MNPAEKRKLALRWAPIHYQGISTDKPEADFITKINYAGSWRTSGNWDALDNSGPLTGAAYYSVTETSSHWYILYAFYHARDWDNLDQHENDFEGFLAIIQRPGNKYLRKHFPDGIFLGMISCAHNHFYSYSNVLWGNRDDIDGGVLFEKGPDGKDHPCSYQEPLGHGCYAYKRRSRACIRYAPVPPGQQLSQPPGITPREGDIIKDAYYELIDIMQPDGFWDRRWSAPLNEPFTVEGRLKGGKFGKDAANPPWRWDDSNDGPDLLSGAMAYDPAHLTWQYFSGIVYRDFNKLFTYTDMPYVITDGKIYGQTATDNQLNDHLNSQSKHERLCAAGVCVSSGKNINESARILVEALTDKGLAAEACSIITHYAKTNAQFRTDVLSLIIDKINDASCFNEPDRAIGLIKVLHQLKENRCRGMIARIYMEGDDLYLKAAVALSLIPLQKIGSMDFYKELRSNLSHPDELTRETSGRLYLKWYITDDPAPILRYASAHYSNLRLLTAEAAAKLKSKKAFDTVVGKLKNSKWDFKNLTSVVLVENYGDKGLRAIRDKLKNDYQYAQNLSKNPSYDLGADFSDCPKGEKDYGRLCFTTELASMMKK